MKSLGQILKDRGYTSVRDGAIKTREAFKKAGYINTNFGWLTKDQLKKGYEMGAIGESFVQEADGSYTFKIKAVEVTTEIEVGEFRTKKKVKKTKLNADNATRWLWWLDEQQHPKIEEFENKKEPGNSNSVKDLLYGSI